MSYQMGYDPVAMGAYLDAIGQAADGTDVNAMTVGGAPAATAGLRVRGSGSYGVSVGTTGTAWAVFGMIVGAYFLLHWDRVRGVLNNAT